MRLICIAAMALLFHSCNRKTITTGNQPATAAKENGLLLGIHTKADLEQPPFKDWFDKNYRDYTLDSFTTHQLQPLLKNKRFELFMGTWCGDSKREVPRIFKILEYAGVRSSQIKMVMVDNRDSMYKQSPGHEEKGKSIHRVPCLIVFDGEKEINRVVEFPVVSLEKDLLAIAKQEFYEPNYKGAAFLLALLNEKNTQQAAADSIALGAKLKMLIRNSAELNSLGYVWMAAGEMEKALLAFQLNASLFPETTNVYDSLGEISLKLNNKAAAKTYYSKVLELQPGNANAVKILAQLN